MSNTPPNRRISKFSQLQTRITSKRKRVLKFWKRH